MGIIHDLEEKKRFTATESEIADYILKHKEQIETMTINELAEKTYSSRAAIMRLMRKTGLSGYREFRVRFSRDLERNTMDEKAIDMNFPFLHTDSSADIMARISDLMTEAVRTGLAEISSEAVEDAATHILEAGKTGYLAVGNSLISTMGFANRLRKLDLIVENLNEFGEWKRQCESLVKGDVLLSVSYSGSHVPDSQLLADLRKRGCYTILITGAQGITGFDRVIAYPGREDYAQNKVATYYSETAVSYILNCIYAKIYLG